MLPLHHAALIRSRGLYLFLMNCASLRIHVNANRSSVSSLFRGNILIWAHFTERLGKFGPFLVDFGSFFRNVWQHCSWLWLSNLCWKDKQWSCQRERGKSFSSRLFCKTLTGCVFLSLFIQLKKSHCKKEMLLFDKGGATTFRQPRPFLYWLWLHLFFPFNNKSDPTCVVHFFS